MSLSGFPPEAAALILLVLGILNCFFGFRVFRVALALWGFAVGAVFAGSLVPVDSGMLLRLSAALVGGVIGAAVFSVLYFAGVFVAGAVLGFLLAAGIANALGMQPNILIGLIVAVIFGLLALAVNKLIIILATSFGGAWSLVQVVALLSGQWQADEVVSAQHPLKGPSALSPLAVLAWLALGALGMFVQYRITAKDKKAS